jgi:hypothetical protein
VIPVRLEPCRVTQHFSHLQYADVFLENGYEQLPDALTTRAGVPGPTPPGHDFTPHEERPATKGLQRQGLRLATAAAIDRSRRDTRLVVPSGASNQHGGA